MDTTDANREAIERVLASEPWLVGVKPAAEVVPRFAPNLILQAAPPGSWDDLSDLLRGGLVGAALFEQLAATEEEVEAKLRMGEIGLGAAQDHSAMPVGPVRSPHPCPCSCSRTARTGTGLFTV